MKFSVCVDNGVFQKIVSISPPTSRWKVLISMEEWEGENKRERTKVIHWLRPLPPSPHPYSMWFRVYSQLPRTEEINENAEDL